MYALIFSWCCIVILIGSDGLLILCQDIDNAYEELIRLVDTVNTALAHLIEGLIGHRSSRVPFLLVKERRLGACVFTRQWRTVLTLQTVHPAVVAQYGML